MGSCFTTTESLQRDIEFLPLLEERYKVENDAYLVNRATGKRVGVSKRPNSYGGIGIRKDGKVHYFNTHRVIWLLAYGLIPISYTINHKDGIKSNTKLTNLECVTVSDNNKHAWSTGLNKPKNQSGSKNPSAKFNDNQVREIRTRYQHGEKVKDLALLFEVSCYTIRAMVSYRSYKNV